MWSLGNDLVCVFVGHIDYGAVVEMAANAKVMEKPDMRSQTCNPT